MRQRSRKQTNNTSEQKMNILLVCMINSDRYVLPHHPITSNILEILLTNDVPNPDRISMKRLREKKNITNKHSHFHQIKNRIPVFAADYSQPFLNLHWYPSSVYCVLSSCVSPYQSLSLVLHDTQPLSFLCFFQKVCTWFYLHSVRRKPLLPCCLLS